MLIILTVAVVEEEFAMSGFGALVLGVFVLVALAAVSPPARRFLKSLVGLGSAKLDAASESVRNTDPLGQYKSQIATAVENGRNAQSVVERAAKQLVSLNNQIAGDLKEKQRLENRLKAVLASGDPNKTAEGYALDLERVETNLQANQAQQASAQDVYDENLKLVERFEREVASARKDAESLNFQLDQSKAEKDLFQMTASLKDQLNLGELAQARRRVQNQIEANKGASKAAHDLSRQGVAEEADEELERKERAAAILARFQPVDQPAAEVGDGA